jgi:hypothetical protein
MREKAKTLGRKRNVCALAVAGAIFAGALPAQAGANDTLLELLVRKGIITQQELKELKEELDRDLAREMERANKVKAPKWLDELAFSGDLRLRAEYFDNEDQSTQNDRWRYRYRLRYGLIATFPEWAKIGVRLSSGGDDPVSTNQSFQDTFSRKSLGIDLAYVTLTPPFADWISVHGGKINNPLWQPSFNSPMQYDGDVTPEGLGEQVSWKFGPDKRHKLFANFGQFILDEVSTDSNDPYLLDSQAGAEWKFGKDPKSPVVKVTAVGGFSRTFNLRQMGVASGSQPGGAGSPGAQSTSPNRGNATISRVLPPAVVGTLFYLDDFEVAYGRGEVAWKLSDKPFLGTPASLVFAGEYIHNFADRYDDLSGSTQTKSPDQTDGWTGQIAFGSSRKKGEWQAAYQYKYLEADATWDAVTDSDWGLGGTDREGHVGKFSYNIRDWWQVGVAGFWTKKISSRPNAGENTRGDDGRHLIRVQGDMVFKF